MNKEMLRFIVELSGGGNGANVAAFTQRYPLTQQTKDDLKRLELHGFVTAVYADDTLQFVIVQPKAHAF